MPDVPPLLYVLVAEPLAEHTRSDPRVRGIPYGDYDHKVSLFADDVLLSVLSPAETVPPLLAHLLDYGAVSGYKLNIIKSEILPRSHYGSHVPSLRISRRSSLVLCGNSNIPGCRRKILFAPKEKGGLGFTHLIQYCIAMQLRIVREWSRRDFSKHWYHMDKAVVGRSLWDLIWLRRRHRPSQRILQSHH